MIKLMGVLEEEATESGSKISALRQLDMVHLGDPQVMVEEEVAVVTQQVLMEEVVFAFYFLPNIKCLINN
ncbi:MAG: hypothetical protein EBZ77_10725 [Chitinophagia bacterium]|nr:hypothetical protein [Chitinophagia bacterium]